MTKNATYSDFDVDQIIPSYQNITNKNNIMVAKLDQKRDIKVSELNVFVLSYFITFLAGDV